MTPRRVATALLAAVLATLWLLNDGTDTGTGSQHSADLAGLARNIGR